MIHLWKDDLGRVEAQIDDNPPGWRISVGKCADEREAVLAALDCAKRYQAITLNISTFEHWAIVAAIMGPDETNRIFKSVETLC